MTDRYNRDGQPLELLAWARLFEDLDYKFVARARVGIVVVSTVWLGIDMAFGSGPPLIFETMIFGGNDDMHQRQWRWPTEAAARAGHERIVTALRAGDLEGAR